MPKLTKPELNLPQFDKLNLPSQRVLMLTGGGLLLLYILWWLLMYVSFDEESLRKRTLATLQQHFGAPVSYAGTSEFSLTPFPTLILRNIQVHNNPRALQRNMIQAPYSVISVHPYSVISDDLIVSLDVRGARIELETFEDASHSWQYTDADGLVDGQPTALISEVTMRDANLHYMYPAVQRDVRLYFPNATMSFPSMSEVDVSGAFIAKERYYQFEMALVGEASRQQDLHAVVSDGASTLTVDGVWDAAHRKAQGKQQFETSDLASFLKGFTHEKYKHEEGLEPKQLVPFAVESQLTYKDNNLQLDGIQFSGGDIVGKGKVLTTFSDVPHIQAMLDFNKLDVTQLVDRGVFTEVIEGGASDQKKRLNTSLPNARAVSLPKGVKVDVVVKAESAGLHHVSVSDLQMAFAMSDGVAKIEQFSGKLAGDTTLVLGGEIEGSLDGIALKGQLDIVGNNLAVFSRELLGSGIAFPERLKRFRGRANLFVNPAVMRLSETVLRLEDVQLVGTLIRQRTMDEKQGKKRDKGYLLEGAFRLENINIDEWVKVQPEIEGGALETYHPLVRKLHYLTDYQHDTEYQFKVNLKNYILDGGAHSHAGFDVALQRGNFMLSGVEASHNGSYLNGDIQVGFSSGKRPEIHARINADVMDTARFFGVDYAKERPFWQGKDGQWSKEEFDLHLLNDYNGNVELNFGEFHHRIWNVSNFRVNAGVLDSLLQIESLEAGIWGGEFGFSGRLRAGKLPTIKGRFTLKNMMVERFHDITDFFDDLHGRVSLQGDVTTTGSNIYYLVQNGQGVLSVAARGLIIDGFNLANMVRAANTVRTVSDIEKLIAFADKGGETTIDAVSGTMNLDGGILQTPGARIMTRMGNGTINGQVNIMESSMNMALIIYLTALQQERPPNIRLVFVGPLHQASRTLDTQSLESFIAKQAAERLLDIR